MRLHVYYQSLPAESILQNRRKAREDKAADRTMLVLHSYRSGQSVGIWA